MLYRIILLISLRQDVYKSQVPDVKEIHIGKYGSLRLNYLKEYRYGIYLNLLTQGKLSQHLKETQEIAQSRICLLYTSLEGKVRNSYTTEVSYVSLQRTVEQARKIARGLGNTIDKKLKRYYKHLDSVFDSLNLQVKDQDRIAKKENREIERYYLDRNIPALQGLKAVSYTHLDVYKRQSM